MRRLSPVLIGWLVAWMLVACNDDGEPAGVATPTPVAEPLAAEAIFADPARFMGDTITVRGEVGEVVTEHGFTLEPGVLVVGRDTVIPEDLAPGDEVLVTGLLERFDISEAERTTGGDYDREEYRMFAGRPSLIATTIRRST